MSKPITATGLMVLVDAGEVDLDAPVERYLGGARIRAYRGSADAVTVRRLANHTSGMPVHWSFFYDGVRPPSRAETIRRYALTWREPGSGST